MVKVTIHHTSGEKAIREHIIEKFDTQQDYEKSVVEAYFSNKDKELNNIKTNFKAVVEYNQKLEKDFKTLITDLETLKSLFEMEQQNEKTKQQ